MSYTREIAKLLEQNRRLTRKASRSIAASAIQRLIDDNSRRAGSLQDEIRQLEADIDAAHDAIVKYEAELEPEDLAWLPPDEDT